MGSTASTARKPQRLGGDDGSSLVEYALLVALIALVCVSAIVYFQKSTSTKLSTASNSIITAGS